MRVINNIEKCEEELNPGDIVEINKGLETNSFYLVAYSRAEGSKLMNLTGQTSYTDAPTLKELLAKLKTRTEKRNHKYKIYPASEYGIVLKKLN